MIKILIVLGLIVLSTQKHGKSIECGELDFANCANKVNCRWGDNETNGQCFDAVYKNLGSRRVISQSVIFDNDDQCDKLIKSGDFIARKTFTNKYFRSWCEYSISMLLKLITNSTMIQMSSTLQKLLIRLLFTLQLEKELLFSIPTDTSEEILGLLQDQLN